MKITRQTLRQIIKEELMREGLFDAPQDERPVYRGDPQMRNQGYDALAKIASKMPPNDYEIISNTWKTYYDKVVEAFNNRDVDALSQAAMEANKLAQWLKEKRNVRSLLGNKTVATNQAFSAAEDIARRLSRNYGPNMEKFMEMLDDVSATGDWCVVQEQLENWFPKLHYGTDLLVPVEGCYDREDLYGE